MQNPSSVSRGSKKPVLEHISWSCGAIVLSQMKALTNGVNNLLRK